MVSTLRQVMISNPGDDTSSSHCIASEALLPPPDAGPCPLCGVTGCYGCTFPRQEEITKEKKHKGVRKKPSGKWSAEIWDPSMKAKILERFQRQRWQRMLTTTQRLSSSEEDQLDVAQRAEKEARAPPTKKSAVEMTTEKEFGRSL